MAVLFVQFSTLIVSIVSVWCYISEKKNTLFTSILNQDLEQRKLIVAMKFSDSHRTLGPKKHVFR